MIYDTEEPLVRVGQRWIARSTHRNNITTSERTVDAIDDNAIYWTCEDGTHKTTPFLGAEIIGGASRGFLLAYPEYDILVEFALLSDDHNG